MIITAHQPTYLPGIILFNKIALADKFIFLGHCKFTNSSWQNRNRIKGGFFLTVPVKHNFGQSIEDAEIDNDKPWKRKHLRSIKETYGKAPYFKDYFPTIEQVLAHEWRTLGPMNEFIIGTICEWLEIETPILRYQDLGLPQQEDGNHLHWLLCEAFRTDRYLHSLGEVAYLEPKYPIKHLWQKFTPPEYPGATAPNLSIIDLLFNCGPQAARIVREAGHVG